MSDACVKFCDESIIYRCHDVVTTKTNEYENTISHLFPLRKTSYNQQS